MKRAIAYLSISIFIAYLTREVLYKGVRNNKNGEYHKLTAIFQKHNLYNAIFIGSSRAESHFNPQIIDSITHLNSFNIGIAGATMPIILGCLEAYLQNSKSPKYVIMNIDFQSFDRNKDTIYNFPRYFPYLDNDKLYNSLNKLDARFLFFK